MKTLGVERASTGYRRKGDRKADEMPDSKNDVPIDFINNSIPKRGLFARDNKVGIVQGYVSETPAFKKVEITFPLPIRIICKFGIAWELAMSLLTFVLVISVSFTAFFSMYVDNTWQVASSMDAIFTIDVIFRLSVEIWRCHRRIQYRIFLVEYTTGIFLLDLLSLIPFEEIFLYSITDVYDLYSLGVIDFFQMNKMLRIYKALKFFSKLQDENRVGEIIVFLCYYGVPYILCAHTFACVMHYFCSETYISWVLHKTEYVKVIGPNSSVETGCYIRLRTLKTAPGADKLEPYPEPIDVYIITFYFIVSVMTTVGYGDLYSTSTMESLVLIFLMLLGALWVTGHLSSILTGFELEQDILRYDLYFRRDGIVKQLMDSGNSSFIIRKVKEYYKYLWIYREGVIETNFPMHEELMYDICQEMFYKAPLFRDMEIAFLHAVAGIVDVQLYNPDMILCRVGNYATTMFYILQGECNAWNKTKDENVACIFRAGCIIGEINMFLSLPYQYTIETRTVCQIATLQKKDLMRLLDGSPYVYALLKQRVERRRQKLRRTYEATGREPNVYVHKRKNVEVTGKEHLDYDYTVVIRKSTGLNPVVKEDIVMDEKNTYIIDMPCTNKEVRKVHARNYSELIAASILIENRSTFIKAWVHVFCLYITFMLVMVPYCAAFSSDTDKKGICQMWFSWYIIILNVIDLFVEIIGAAPVTGLYYQFMDGISLQIYQPTFYLELISIIPFEYMYVFPLLQKLTYYDFSSPWDPVVLRSLWKVWKINRYFHYLDNRFHHGVLLIRIAKYCVICPLFTHWVACIFFWQACPNGWGYECREINWLNLQFTQTETSGPTVYVGETNHYAISLYFAAATVTTVGFGDFTVQTSLEMLWCVIMMIAAFFLLMHLLAGIMSVLTARIRPQLIFHQKLDAIKCFMHHYGLGESIQERVLEHFKLQHKLKYEVQIPTSAPINNLMYDAPVSLLNDALYSQYLPYLEGVTIFSKCSFEKIIKTSKLLRRYLLPPSITFMDAGEVRRQMYIVYKGSIALFTSPDDEIPTYILEPTGYHGIRDLLYGEPCQYTIKTMGNVILLVIDYTMVHDLFSDEKYFMDFMTHSGEENLYNVEILSKRTYKKSYRHGEEPQKQFAWIEYPKNDWDYTGSNYKTTLEEYEEPCRLTKYGNLMRLFLLPFTIHPAGTFAKFWVILNGINSLILLITLVVESMLDYRTPEMRTLQILLEIFNCMDLYVKLHWAYYDEDGMFYYHPIKTFLKSVYHGNFFYDLCLMCPAELIMFIFGLTNFYGYGHGYYWYSWLRWGRFFRLYKLPELFYMMYSTFQHRIIVLSVMYGLVYILMVYFFAIIAINDACPNFSHSWNEGDEYKLPKCMEETWITLKFDQDLDHLPLGKRFILAFYYVNQVILLIGYGDVFTTRAEEFPFLMALILFGTFAYLLIIADLSASMVDSDEARHVFREQRNRILIILQREDAPKLLYNNVRNYFRRKWYIARGVRPQTLFQNLHPMLEGDLFQEFVGEIFDTVPLFQGFEPHCLRAMCQFMRKEWFCEGQRISRYGNMEFEMCVIVDGEVFIADRELQWKCSLSKGEMFGELSLIYGIPRHFSVFAASNVEAYVISANDFANFLQLYQYLKEKITSALTDEGIEYYEIKYRAQQLEDSEAYAKDKEKNTKLIQEMVRANEAQLTVDEDATVRFKIHRKPWLERMFGHGIETTPSQFFYFIDKMIHPECGFMRLFIRVIVGLSFVSPVLETYKVFFFNQGATDHITEIIYDTTRIFEFIFLFHIILNFCTAYEQEDGNFCRRYSRVAVKYVGNPKLFLVDVISTAPIGIFAGKHSMWFVIRFFRLIPYFDHLIELENDLEVSNFQFKITISGSIFFLISHIMACIFYVIACPTRIIKECRQDSWVVKLQADHFERTSEQMDSFPSRWYIRSFYWVMTTLTSTGFGDITPNNQSEIEFTMFVMLFCAFGLCIVLGHLITGFQSSQQAKREFFYNARIYVNHLRGIGLSASKQHLLMGFYLLQWHNSRGVSYQEAISVLPLSLQYAVSTAIYYKCVFQCKFFGFEPEVTLIRNICVRFKHQIYLPGNIIVHQGNLDGNLYIVFKGKVSAYRTDRLTGEPIFLKRYTPNYAFGKVPALFHEVSYNKSYRADGYVEVLTLHQNDIKHVAKNYPRWKRFLKKLIIKRYPNLAAEPFISNIFESRKGMHTLHIQ